MKIDRTRLTGPQSGVAKYDLLTALSLLGLHGEPRTQISALRLIALVTARYNWRIDELCVCQRDMARMWGVTERTVKREVKAWIEARWLNCVRQGVRSRAGAYRLDLVEIHHRAQGLWPLVGTDFVDRMAAGHESPAVAVPQLEAVLADEVVLRGTWRAASRRLRLVDPAGHAAWFAPLRLLSDEGGTVTLAAPTRFVAHYIETRLRPVLAEAVAVEMGPERRIVLCVEPEAGGAGG